MVQNRRRLRRFNEKDPFPGATHINVLSDAAERMAEQRGHGYGVGPNNLPPFNQRTFVVTAEGCDGNASLFTIKPRYWSSDAWASDSDNQGECLDPTDVGINLAVGDVLTAFWDDQRGAWIPINVVTGNQDAGSSPSGCCGTMQNAGPVLLPNGGQLALALFLTVPGVDCCGEGNVDVSTVTLTNNVAFGQTRVGIYTSTPKDCCVDENGRQIQTYWKLDIPAKTLQHRSYYRPPFGAIEEEVLMEWVAIDPYVPQSPSRFRIDQSKTSAGCRSCVDDICIYPDTARYDCGESRSICLVDDAYPPYATVTTELNLTRQEVRDPSFFGFPTPSGWRDGPDLNSLSLDFTGSPSGQFWCWRTIQRMATQPDPFDPPLTVNSSNGFEVAVQFRQALYGVGTGGIPAGINPYSANAHIVFFVGFWAQVGKYSPQRIVWEFAHQPIAIYVYRRLDPFGGPDRGSLSCPPNFAMSLDLEWVINSNVNGFPRAPGVGTYYSQFPSWQTFYESYAYEGWPGSIDVVGRGEFPTPCDPYLRPTPPAIP